MLKNGAPRGHCSEGTADKLPESSLLASPCLHTIIQPCAGEGRPTRSEQKHATPFLRLPTDSSYSSAPQNTLPPFSPRLLLQVSAITSSKQPTQIPPHWLRYLSSAVFWGTHLGTSGEHVGTHAGVGQNSGDLCFPTGALCPRYHNCLLSRLSH